MGLLEREVWGDRGGRERKRMGDRKKENRVKDGKKKKKRLRGFWDFEMVFWGLVDKRGKRFAYWIAVLSPLGMGYLVYQTLVSCTGNVYPQVH